MKIKNILLNPWLIGIVVSIISSVPLVLPLLHPGYFPSHDGEWAVVRLGDMFRTLRDGQFPARYSGALNFGYGYPLFNFAYPFPYYLGFPLHFLKFGFIDSIKILFAISIPLSAFFMFLASRKFWNNTWSGVVSSILYVYFPYRIVDLYVRGSIGECLSFVLLPLILYSGLMLLEKKQSAYIALLSISVALLIGTHNIMTVLYLPIFTLVIIAKALLENKKNEDKKTAVISILQSLLLGLGLSAFFFLPALIEEHNILLSVIPIADRNMYFVSIPQLIFSSFGYGVPGGPGAFTYQLGWGHLLTLAILLVAAFLQRKNKDVKFTYLFIGIYLVCFALLFKETAVIWEHTPFLKEINYPWILLSQLGFLTALVAGFIAARGKYYLYILIIPIVVSIVMIIPNAKPSEFVYHTDDYYLTNEATTTSSHELMPLWVKKIPVQHFAQKVQVIKGAGKISNIIYNSHEISFDYSSDAPSIVQVSTIYYPGWTAFSNGREKGIFYDNDQGLMQLKLTSGNQNIKLVFGETPVRLFADILSLCSAVVVIGLLLQPLFGKKTKTKK